MTKQQAETLLNNLNEAIDIAKADDSPALQALLTNLSAPVLTMVDPDAKNARNAKDSHKKS